MGIFLKYGLFSPCTLTKYGHVTWPKLQISKIFHQFVPILYIRESHKISDRKVLYFRDYQPKTSWGTPRSVSLGSIDFFIQSHHHDLPYSKRSWKLILKTINSTAGYSPSHLYLRHALIFLEIRIFLKKGFGWNLKRSTWYFFCDGPRLISCRKCATYMRKRDAQ